MLRLASRRTIFLRSRAQSHGKIMQIRIRVNEEGFADRLIHRALQSLREKRDCSQSNQGFQSINLNLVTQLTLERQLVPGVDLALSRYISDRCSAFYGYFFNLNTKAEVNVRMDKKNDALLYCISLLIYWEAPVDLPYQKLKKSIKAVKKMPTNNKIYKL